MKLPEIDLDKMEEFKRKNFRDRLKFINDYVAWLKKNPKNSGQKDLIG